MKIWKKAVSAFLAAVTTMTMIFTGSVTASAANSPYSVHYDPAFVVNDTGETREVLIFEGLTTEEFNYYMSVINDGAGTLYLSIMFNDDVYFGFAQESDGSKSYAYGDSDDGGFKAILAVTPSIALDEDGTRQGGAFILHLNGDTISDTTRQLMKNTKTCKAGILVEIGDSSINYQNLYGYNDVAFSVVGSNSTNNSSSKSVSSLSATVKNQTYTGKARTPDVTIKDGGKTLKKGTDYILTYKNNKKIGTASVTIKGKGDYSGEQTLTFQIVPKKTTVTAKKSGGKITLSWKKADGAEKYQIYYREKGSSKYKKLTTVSGSKTSYSTSKPDKNKTYQFKIRSYAESGGKKYYSSYSKVVTTK